MVVKKLGKRMEYLEIASNGWEGGLVILWTPQVIQLLSYEATKSYISIEIQVVGNSETYLCTNVYGPQKLEAKLLFLRSLFNLKLRYPQAKAIFGGDFNMITSLTEKRGGIRKLNRDFEAFLDFIRSANLIDVFPKSDAFTWNNKRGGERQIASRLDGFVVTESILLEGIIVESNILPSGGSDHWPITMTAAIQGTPRNKPFRFEKFWLTHLDFIQKIEQWWKEPLGTRGTKMYLLQAKLKHIKAKIKVWNHEFFGNIFKEKKKLEEKMEHIHEGWIQGNIYQDTMDRKKKLMKDSQLRCQQEETLWKQKSQIQWLKEGEQNTKLFHRSTIDHRGANKILSRKDEQRANVQTHQEISNLLITHFSRIAHEPGIDREEAIEELASSIPKLISEEQNIALSREISSEEVEEAVKEMPNGIAPGPDGFTIEFYKTCWEIVKIEVWEAVEDS